MGQDQNSKARVRLKLVPSNTSVNKQIEDASLLKAEAKPKQAFQSAFARQLDSYVDELDKQIAALLNS